MGGGSIRGKCRTTHPAFILVIGLNTTKLSGIVTLDITCLMAVATGSNSTKCYLKEKTPPAVQGNEILSGNVT